MNKINVLVCLSMLALTACKTVEEAAIDNAKQACERGGYGEASASYGACMQHLTPMAAQIEQQRRNALIQAGMANIANSVGGRPVAGTAPDVTTSVPPRTDLEHRTTWCMRSNVGGQIVCQ